MVSSSAALSSRYEVTASDRVRCSLRSAGLWRSAGLRKDARLPLISGVFIFFLLRLAWETPVAIPSSTICNWTNSTSLDADSFATQPSLNTFYVVAKDEAGNVNYSSYANINFTADTPAPSIPLNIDIADVSVKATSSWKLVVSWEEPENVGVGIEHYQIYHSTDEENFVLEGTTSGISYVIVGLTQEEHFYKIKACDSANNCSAFFLSCGDVP